jgi:hypothetical protein
MFVSGWHRCRRDVAVGALVMMMDDIVASVRLGKESLQVHVSSPLPA